jgi:hypothetical protein
MNPAPDNAPEPELPPKLDEVLRSLSRPKIVVPLSIDAVIARAAKDHFRREDGRATAPAEPPGACPNGESAALATHWRSGDAEDSSLRIVRLPAARREPSPYRWLAAAAALVIGLFLLRPWERPSRPELRADLDRSGQVDVLDAFLLARELAAGSANPRLDVNGDGRVDQRDVETATQLAVRLPEGI